MRIRGWWALGMLGAMVGATPLGAQEWTVDAEGRWCESDWGGDAERYCEAREVTLAASDRLEIDGDMNGGVAVTGWSRNEVRVVAKVWANASDLERAEEIAREVDVSVRGGRVRSDGPSTARREGWGVSYEIMVPTSTDLEIRTHNGGISIEDVDGSIVFEALNGGVRLAGLAGDVRGMTTNGGLTVELTGAEWEGRGLDVETTNGGVRMLVPDGYSARLETATVNGGMEIGFPVTVRGRIGKELATTLGRGGALVRAVTTNGGVSIDRSTERR